VRSLSAATVRRAALVNLFVAFAFTVMADPVSSVAYAIESPLHELDGDLGSLFPTMALVMVTIVAVAASYHQLVRRFPDGGGGPRIVAAAWGEGYAFIPLGALLVDFTLTVAISSAAAASAFIAYAPQMAGGRIVLALVLAALVACGICLGHWGRVVFATASLFFLLASAAVIAHGAERALPPAAAGGGGSPLVANASLASVALAMPLGMALATGVEAPSNAIAQLGQLGDRGRRRFGQMTIWLMVGIVGGLTLTFAALVVSLGVGLPPEDSTLLAELAREVAGDGVVFGAFQITSALLLLAAAGSSFLAASGLLGALARHGDAGARLVPAALGLRNRWFVPYWGVMVVFAVSAGLVALAGGRDQELVRFYAVSVFASFLGALLGCARFSRRDRRRFDLAVNLVGIALVAFALALNLRRLDGVIALGASAAVSLYLWSAWVRRGRPRGISRLGSRAG
jgi:Amino acid permease